MTKICGGGYTLIEKMYKRALVRRELGIPRDANVLLSVGELNDNKNHETVIKAINGMNVYYVIAGTGDKKDYLQGLIDEQHMTDRIKLLGFRSDVKDIYKVADIFVFPSFREGLSVALMEAMASGLPCVVSKIRGNVDLIDENGGMLFDPHDILQCKDAVQTNLEMSCDMGRHNRRVIQAFSINEISNQMKQIYNNYCSK